MDAYFGLGSNLGDRRENLRAGIAALAEAGARVVATSPVVESPAMLPPGAPSEWDRSFLNLAVRAEVRGSPATWYERIAAIEDSLGRDRAHRWGPRPLDIDILLWGDEQHADRLVIPHAGLCDRDFVLTPLLHLAPNLRVPGIEQTVFRLTETVPPIPLWMAIVNITPDSFSDGGRFADQAAFEKRVDELLDGGAHIIDLGAESTRPGATPIDANEEWTRLSPALAKARERLDAAALAPTLSVDTRHAEVARRAIDAGADIINDVGGLNDADMIKVARESNTDWIVMHHLGLPADRERVLPPHVDPIEAVADWIRERIDVASRHGIDPSRLIVDPGIGFGKNAHQSLTLLRGIKSLRQLGARLLVGHSRKSFMHFADRPVAERDLETIGVSLQLCRSGVDILRVHDVESHIRAYRAWSHASPALTHQDQPHE
ncbi:MAG: dihydropteroate synthase [Pseudomonadota bacterium]